MVDWDGTVVLRTPRLLLRTFGYATEAATAWLDHAFGPLALPRVISITDPPNLRSLAVMRRLGMSFDREAEVEDNGVRFRAVIYAITAEQWRTARW
jgi:RimJ/RimL family protein N-acetyltransferase